MEKLKILSRSEMRNIYGGRIDEGCHVHPVIIIINGDCQGTLACDGDLYKIPCCSDFGKDVGWCR